MSDGAAQTVAMLMSGPANHLCIFCRWVEAHYWAKGPHERCLGCLNPDYQRGMASENKSCCLFEREPGADDELERELEWAIAPLNPMPPHGPGRVFSGVAPVHMPAPRPAPRPQPLSRAIMADYYPQQATRVSSNEPPPSHLRIDRDKP